MNQLPLKINTLSKSFGSQKVLQDVSFDVKPGEIFGLIGLNGAGKTTLIKIILGFLSQDKGDATIFGMDAKQTKARANLSYLPEKFNPSQFLKGGEFLSLSLSYFGKKYDSDLAQEKAIALDLDPAVLDHRVGKYSKGMGQKLGLLSALLTDAPLLILDEPMSGLDPKARILLKDNLLEYRKTGKTIFFSSHILADIEEICDRIAILHDNKMVFIGTADEFKRNYEGRTLERSFLTAIKAA
jgi:ABC-2 type transport system ATP-binding protein